jgi:hypothetical protein
VDADLLLADQGHADALELAKLRSQPEAAFDEWVGREATVFSQVAKSPFVTPMVRELVRGRFHVFHHSVSKTLPELTAEDGQKMGSDMSPCLRSALTARSAVNRWLELCVPAMHSPLPRFTLLY